MCAVALHDPVAEEKHETQHEERARARPEDPIIEADRERHAGKPRLRQRALASLSDSLARQREIHRHDDQEDRQHRPTAAPAARSGSPKSRGGADQGRHDEADKAPAIDQALAR